MAPSFTRWSILGGRGLNACLRIPLEAKSQTLNSYTGCHQTKKLLLFPSGQPKGLGRTFPSLLLPSKGTKEMQRHYMQKESTSMQFYDGLIQLSCKSIGPLLHRWEMNVDKVFSLFSLSWNLWTSYPILFWQKFHWSETCFVRERTAISYNHRIIWAGRNPQYHGVQLLDLK